ncbi:LacI family DNA-binding transcriptional regulator [Microbacterium amylolyticum]|uniref:DNA-binding LacI/PurR family transcriptional regulator n=1 Tax=Microbacterium amylolyticum TaxID=936337 RepID=A0ABS4ZKE6_9MICO|nr:LacI family DNA-binding transcriptional regulator [Microbacterium amylolyticum]MBP2437493.1 DNA-binding LacI/PurR family transcriptional regulator [Microbacterium amylolyticum]
MPVTMNDVARVAGVSAMTVSNVLTGRRVVSDATRERVEAAAEQLGYALNLTARHLRAGRTNTIALVIPNLDHPYFGELAARFDRLLRSTGRHLVVEQTGSRREAELSALNVARLRLYDGVLLSVVGMRSEEIATLRSDMPVVILGEQDVSNRFDHVGMDNVGGARIATSHLLSRGSRRILILGGAPEGDDASGMSLARTNGWRQAHHDAGMTPEDDLIIPLEIPSAEHGHATILRLVRDGFAFDGVFTVTDTLATGVLAGLSESGRRVPEDVQVVGFDSLDGSRFTVPPLTTIDPGHEEMATEALRLLDRLIERDEGAPRERVKPPARLIRRGSTR